MKSRFLLALLLAAVTSPVFALDGTIGIHDPSTVIQSNGKWFTWGTGGGGLVSNDGWTWAAGTRGGVSGMAPDCIKVGDNYFMFASDNNGGQPHSHINLATTKSLDPSSPDYKWEVVGEVNSTDGIEDCNGIDPGAFYDTKTNKLWLTFGSYFGYIRIVELDPKTGKRIDPTKFTNLSINMEASDMIEHDGWYYLFGTRGSCCRGADSGYNIRVGRSKSPTGPFVDDQDVPLIKGGGKLMCASSGRWIGPGHFGLIDCGDGVQKFSMHYEADLDRGGASVLDIRPLLWKDGWPVAGDNVKDGNYEIESARTGTALELAVQGQPVGGGGRGGGGRGGGAGAPGGRGGRGGRGGAPGGAPAGPGAMGPARIDNLIPVAAPGRGGGGGGGGRGGGGAPVPAQEAAAVAQTWPTGAVDIRLANYMLQAQQKWTIAPAPNAGGYLGSPYFKITITGTERALAANDAGDLVAVPAFTGAPEQLWQIDQLPDGTYRIMPKEVPGSKDRVALSAIGNSAVVLSKFDPASLKQRWNLKTP